MVVCVPVADLRRTQTNLRLDYSEDQDQETQLLYGEHVMAYEFKDGWVRVEAIQQKEFTHNNFWQGYPGWMREETLMPVEDFPENEYIVIHRFGNVYARPGILAKRILKLSIGSRFTKVREIEGWLRISLLDGTSGWIRKKDVMRDDGARVAEKVLRHRILSTAKSLLGGPYLWGGRSAHDSSLEYVATGVDCSGLVNLCYMVNGIMVPRDAHEQYVLSNPVSPETIKPADLIFLAKPDQPKRMVHVMMYIGHGRILEASGRDHVIRVISFEKRIGRPIKDVPYGHLIQDRYVYYGSYVTDYETASPTH